MSESNEIPHVDVHEARRRVDEGAFLLDVRESDEWTAGHAPDATFLPMGQVTAAREQLPRDRTILAICRSGARSGRVTAALVSWGYDARNVAGGMQAWAAAGQAVVTDDGAPGAVA
jgi:rhodanese-related sulfurtransferase